MTKMLIILGMAMTVAVTIPLILLEVFILLVSAADRREDNEDWKELQ